jgi:hypothetical protein
MAGAVGLFADWGAARNCVPAIKQQPTEDSNLHRRLTVCLSVCLIAGGEKLANGRWTSDSCKMAALKPTWLCSFLYHSDRLCHAMSCCVMSCHTIPITLSCHILHATTVRSVCVMSYCPLWGRNHCRCVVVVVVVVVVVGVVVVVVVVVVVSVVVVVVVVFVVAAIVVAAAAVVSWLFHWVLLQTNIESLEDASTSTLRTFLSLSLLNIFNC